VIWSFVLAGLAFVGMWLMWEVGNGRRWAWLGQAALGLPWVAYSFTTGQYGFLLTTAISIAINVRNFAHRLEEAPC
jgi:hypothetical protein